MEVNQNQIIKCLYNLDDLKLVDEDTVGMKGQNHDWTDDEILSLLDELLPNLTVLGFELTESASMRVTVAASECSNFEVQGDLDLIVWTHGRTLTGLTKNQIGLFLEVNKYLGDRGAAAVATLIAGQQV